MNQPAAPAVRDNPAESRFELDTDAGLAVSYYKRAPGVLTVLHTEVPPAASGQGVGSRLARGVLDAVRAEGLKVIAKCPFVAAYMARHREYDDLAA